MNNVEPDKWKLLDETGRGDSWWASRSRKLGGNRGKLDRPVDSAVKGSDPERSKQQIHGPESRILSVYSRLNRSEPFISKRRICAPKNMHKPAICCCKPTYLYKGIVRNVSVSQSLNAVFPSTPLQVQVGKQFKILRRRIMFQKGKLLFLSEI
jgi:hypothetical protein